ncbi:MAG: CoA transferase [Rhodospirillales bacterium]
MDFHKKKFDSDYTGILDGIRVIDLSRLVAGNTLTKMLADFGAEVIKIEPIPDGDPYRNWHASAISLHWKEYCRNKKSVSLNLRTDEGKRILHRLLADADCFVENYRPGRLEQMGFEPDKLIAANDKLIVARLSGYGQTGPYREYGGFGTLVEAMSGFASRNGFADREPVLPPLAMADMIAGITGAMATAMALYHRDLKNGGGQIIDLSLLEPLYMILGPEAARYKMAGTVRKRSGSSSQTSCPRGVYQTKDGKWVSMSASIQSMAHRLFRAIGRADMVDDPRYRTNADRIQRREEVDGIVGDFIKQKTLEENLAFFRREEITVGPVFDISQIVEDEHYREREIIVDLPDEDLGWMPMHNIVPRLSKTPGGFKSPAPKLGEHNAEILGGLGYDAAGLERLRAENVIV